jgi:hypothetical protein
MSAEDPMCIEDRVRTATRAGATLVRDIGPLAAEPERAGFRRRPAPSARRWGSWGSSCLSLHLTPDGGTAVCGTQYGLLGASSATPPCPHGALKLIAYSVRTGQPVRVLYAYRGACNNGVASLLWTDGSAAEIIGAIQADIGHDGGKQAAQLGVITDGRLRPLTLSKSVSVANYAAVAF